MYADNLTRSVINLTKIAVLRKMHENWSLKMVGEAPNFNPKLGSRYDTYITVIAGLADIIIFSHVN